MYITVQGPVSEMTYTVSSGTLNPTIPYHQLSLCTFNTVLEAYFLETILTDICTDLKQSPDTRLQADGFN